jgi:HD-GYP domain-containing protein (c-di-GMP phosphodiesterase class II)
MLKTKEKNAKTACTLQPAERHFTQTQCSVLEDFASRINKLGADFAVCEKGGEMVMFSGASGSGCPNEKIAGFAPKVLRELEQVSKPYKQDFLLGSVLTESGKAVGAAIIDLTNLYVEKNSDVDVTSTQTEQNDSLAAVFTELLSLLAERFEEQVDKNQQIEKFSNELAQVYEELVLLHKLSMNMKVTEADADFLQMACDSLTDIVSVEGIAVLLDKEIDGERRLIIAAGSGIIDIDEHMAGVLRSWLGDEIAAGKEALLDSEVDSPFKYQWPDAIKNIIAVPLFGKEKAKTHTEMIPAHDAQIIGLMAAVNRIDKPDFDSIDVKLFNSVANGCAVFVENGRLFSDLKELFIGSLKALTSSIDAKDPYTRGHSERVAFISRWIAERLAEKRPLEPHQIYRIYLAGLLHDIGKVGVDEAILRKKGKLTEAEFDCIKKHPSIGAGILSGIKQMSDIVPGVLSHHERIDGKGYPNGISGEKIPLIARIIGLADSFDAMTSKRTYRNAMSVEQALVEVKKGLGSQFDEQIGRVFLESDVYRLWDIMQDGFSEAYGGCSFSEYGTIAVGALVG